MSVVLPSFATSGLEPQLASGLVERFASELARRGNLEVLTQRDIERMLGIERQRQLMGCEEASASSCMAELTEALGADAIISGSLVKVGTGWTATLRVLRTSGGQVLFSESGRGADDAGLQDWLDDRAGPVRSRLLAAFNVVDPRDARPRLPWVFVGVGGLCAIAGAVLSVFAHVDAGVLASVQPGSTVDVHGVRASGQAKETAGFALLGIGAALVAAGLLWSWLSWQFATRG